MGCANSISKKPLNFMTEQTTFDDVDDEDSTFNSAEFSTTLRWSIACCASVLARNVAIINLVRLQHENSIVIEYTVTTVDAITSIINLMSSIATYIATGAMSSYFRINGFHNVSANTPQCYMKFFDLSPTKKNHVLKIIQVSKLLIQGQRFRYNALLVVSINQIFLILLLINRNLRLYRILSCFVIYCEAVSQDQRLWPGK